MFHPKEGSINSKLYPYPFSCTLLHFVPQFGMPLTPFFAVLILLHLLPCPVLRYPIRRGVYVTEALHVHSLCIDTRTAPFAVACTEDLSRVLLALAPFVDCEILPAHCDLTMGYVFCCFTLLFLGRSDIA